MIRILHVTDSLGEGGSERNLLTLVRSLGQDVAEHDVVWLYDDTRLAREFAPHVKSLSYLRAGKGVRLLAAAWRLSRLISERQPQVVHAGAIRAQLVARVAALVSRVPVVTTWQCVSYNDRMFIELGFRGRVLRLVTWLLDLTTGMFDRHFIAVSREVAEFNRRKLLVSAKRVSVVYNAVDTGRLQRVSQAAVELKRREFSPTGGPLLLSVGRLVDQKNHSTAIAAMAIVAQHYPDARLLIAGAGPLEAELRNLVNSSGLQRFVSILGPRPDVPELLAMADVFVFASFFEGFGIALAEALGAGVPVVASSIATSREVADGSDAVRYFETKSSEDLARAVVEVLGDLDRLKRIASAGRDKIVERFDAAEMATKFLAIVTSAAQA